MPVAGGSEEGRGAAAIGEGDTPAGSSRDRLLDAAVDVFCERGYERTTVALVARRAGLTTGAIYGNFRDKAELLLRAIDRNSARAVADLEAARRAGVGAVGRLVLLGRRLVADPQPAQRRLVVEMFAAARRDPGMAARVQEALRATEHELGRLVERAVAEGDVDPRWDARLLARFAMAVGVGELHLRSAGMDGPDPAAWAALVRHLVASLGPGGSGSEGAGAGSAGDSR